jgi:hypothetical protein
MRILFIYAILLLAVLFKPMSSWAQAENQNPPPVLTRSQLTMDEIIEHALDAYKLKNALVPGDRIVVRTSEGEKFRYDITRRESSVRWGRAIGQSLLFTGSMHILRLPQEKTTREFDGNFVDDWFASLKPLKDWHWADGDSWVTNYAGHGLEGATYAFIYAQNDPKARNLKPGFNRPYMTHLGKAYAFSAVSSLQFEIGPFSEASIGNVGINARPGAWHMSYLDIIVTPTVGTLWMFAEDAVDKRFLARWEADRNGNKKKILMRIILNPARSVANMVRFKKPWYRDDRR